MGGGDLNTKKSWHPNTMKNQERVWKAEQQEAAEKRRLNELRREIDEERNREELKSIAKKSGIIPTDDAEDKKLEWMYKGPSQLVNREEYLLGRTIDKTFEELDAQEKAASSTFGVAQPKNHVEHECIPFSIRQHKGMVSNDQVDLARKLMEDPLMLIKQKQIESRQKILQNPVKLKELHRLLKRDESLQDTDKKKKMKDKKSKKSKKSKKKRKKSKRGSSDSSGSGSDSEGSADLDQLLAEKYKKVQSTMAGESQDGVSFDKLLTMKYQKLSKELDMMGSSKTKKKKAPRERSNCSASSESDRGSRVRADDHRRVDQGRPYRQDTHQRNSKDREESRHRRRDRPREPKRRNEDEDRRNEPRHHFPDRSDRNRSRSRSRDKYRNKSPTRPQKRSPQHQDRATKDDRGRYRSRSRSPLVRQPRRDAKRSSRSRSPERKGPTQDVRRKVKQQREASTSSSGSDSSADSSPARPTTQDSDDERRIKKVRNFGLVSASGEKLEIKSHSNVRLYKPEEIRAEQSKQKPSWTKPTGTKRPLTEQEMEEKRLAMMSNAQWREKDRETNVRRYHEEDNREQASTSREYDKEFLTKQFKRAAASETVESRIRSNRNNIQRTNGAMDRNFAKR